MLLLLLWACIGVVLFAVRSVLLPFFLAAFFAYLGEPLVALMTKKEIKGFKLPRFGAVLILYGLLFALLWLSAVFLVPRVYDEGVRLATTLADSAAHIEAGTLDVQIDKANNFLERTRLPVRVSAKGDISDDKTLYTLDLRAITKDAFSQTREMLQDKSGFIAQKLRDIVGGTIGFVFQLFVVLMLTAFLLLDTDRIKQFFFSIVPLEDRDQYDELLARIDHGLNGVVRGQLMICAINGVLTLVGMLIFDVKYAFLLAIVAAVFSLVPVFGSILSTIPIVAVAFFYSGFGTAFGVLVWIVVIHLVEANLLNPKIMGDAAKIHPVVIVLALVTGEHFYGLAGALFAVPVASIGLTVFRFLQNKAQELQSDMAAERPRQNSKAAKPKGVRLWREPRR